MEQQESGTLAAPGRGGVGLCYALSFVSGAAALIAEISWSRQIGLLFGHTVQAAAIVLAAYFTGLAVGYLAGAKWGGRFSPLRLYGGAELAAAVWTCLIPWLLAGVQSSELVGWLSHPSPVVQTTVRGVFCLLLLLPATTALGVTLPALAEFLSASERGSLSDPASAGRVTLAYAINTAGALAGVLAATFVLLVNVGVTRSSYLAAGLSTLCALGAWLYPKVAHRVEQPVAETATQTPWGWIGLAGLSGFVTLGLETLYTRMFSLVFHNSTYTFGAVVAVFLAALAGGAALTSRLQRHCQSESLAGWAGGLGALATAGSVPLFVELTDLEYFTWGESFAGYLAGVLGLVTLVVGPPILLLGMLLPVAWKAAAAAGRSSQIVGRLTAANTLAAAGGALAASFLLLPGLGLWPSFVLLATLAQLAALLLLARAGRRVLALGGAVAFAGLAVVAWGSPLEAEGSRKQRGETLVRRWDSAYGWIDLVQVERTGTYKVRQNLHYRFGQTGDNAREFRQAHLPLLLHPQPREVLCLGLGTGLTAGGAVPHVEVERLVAVELIPEVVEAARAIGDYNFHVVDNPRTEMRVDDARHYLLATDREFDVIISDLFVPWESESGYLYTVEHYRAARRKLRPGGLFCQWLPLYQLGSREFELIADSFASVFPVTTVWWGQMYKNAPVLALIGSEEPLTLDAREISPRLTALWETIGSTDGEMATVEALYDCWLGDWTPRHPEWLNTDEHPRVEFLTPISNRDRQLIRGRALRAYFDEVLSDLPSASVTLRGTERPAPSAAQRRANQRFILFGE